MNQRHVIARGLRLAMSAAELPVLVLVKPSWRPKPKPPRKDRWVGWPEVQLERIRTHEVAMQEWHEWKLQHDEEMLVWTRHEKRQRYERNRDKAAHNHADLQDIDQNASQLSPQPAVGPITFAELCDRLARAVVEASTPLPLPPPLRRYRLHRHRFRPLQPRCLMRAWFSRRFYRCRCRWSLP